MIIVSYKSCFATSMGYDAAATLFKMPLLFHKRNSIIILLVNEGLKIELLNNIKIYRDGEVV